MNTIKRCAVTIAVAGVVGCGIAASPSGAATVPAAPAAPAAECPSPRVTGLSALLDAFSTGSAAGPSIFYGAALAVLSQPLPDPIGTYQAQFLAQGAQGVQQMRSDAPLYIDQFRTVIAPFAVGNEFANQGVDAFADGLDAFAATGGNAIAPGDRSLREIAVLFRVAREAPAAAC